MLAKPALHELQKQFMDALFDVAAPGPTARVAGNGLTSEARLRIYRHSCNEIQTAALRTSYPAVLTLVGEDWFDQTARGYRRAYPSDSGNLQKFGTHFGDYLETLPACRSIPYLSDVARLEWLRQQTILAAEAEPMTSEIFAECLRDSDGSSLRIVFHPSVHWLNSRHRVLTIWRFAMQPSPEQLTLDGEGENVALWREDGKVAMVAPDPASFTCMTALAQNQSLCDAYAEAAVLDADFDFAQCMENLLQHGLVASIRPFAVTCGKTQS